MATILITMKISTCYRRGGAHSRSHREAKPAQKHAVTDGAESTQKHAAAESTQKHAAAEESGIKKEDDLKVN